MSKKTIAALLPSTTRQGPWGDDGWLPAGLIHYVAHGPDFLAAASRPIGGPDGPPPRFGAMEVRSNPVECAADVAVMAAAMLELRGWRDLEKWWDGMKHREALAPALEQLVHENADNIRLGIVMLSDHDGHRQHIAEVGWALDRLGVRTTTFVEQ